MWVGEGRSCEAKEGSYDVVIKEEDKEGVVMVRERAGLREGFEEEGENRAAGGYRGGGRKSLTAREREGATAETEGDFFFLGGEKMEKRSKVERVWRKSRHNE